MRSYRGLLAALAAGSALGLLAVAVHAGSLSGAVGDVKDVAARPTAEKVHSRMHEECYLHTKWPAMACHKHVQMHGKWTVQNCRPEDCEGVTIKGGEKGKRITPD